MIKEQTLQLRWCNILCVLCHIFSSLHQPTNWQCAVVKEWTKNTVLIPANMTHTSCRMATEWNRVFPLIITLFTLSLAELVVDRRNQGLKIIPDDIDPGVTTLNLRHNSITQVEEGDMDNLLLLEKLNLDHNKVNFINTRAFIHNVYLAVLRIVDHELLTFPTEVGGAWRSIEQIIGSLGPNNMQPINLTNLPALIRFEINTNTINILTLRHLPSLKALLTQTCGLEILPDLSVAPTLELVNLNFNFFYWSSKVCFSWSQQITLPVLA